LGYIPFTPAAAAVRTASTNSSQQYCTVVPYSTAQLYSITLSYNTAQYSTAAQQYSIQYSTTPH
jgi:hypothetical protein